MEFTKQDLAQCENLIRALKKGNFTLDGVEIPAMAQALSWIGQLHAVMKAQIDAPPMKMEQVISPVIPPPAAPAKVQKASKKGV